MKTNKNNSSFLNQHGITLIEILIVLGIIGAAMSIVVGNFNLGSRDIRRELRRIPVISRQLYQQAQIDNRVYRLVIQFAETEKELHTYYAEVGTEDSLPSLDPNEKPKLDENGQVVSDYQLASAITKEPHSLPEDFMFKTISYNNRDDILNEGKAYIYYFPQGLSEEAVIHIARKDEKLNWTLVSNPLTGKIDILEGEYDRKQISQE